MYGAVGARRVLIRIMTRRKAFVFDFHDSTFHLCASVSGPIRVAERLRPTLHERLTGSSQPRLDDDYIGIFLEIIHRTLCARMESLPSLVS